MCGHSNENYRISEWFWVPLFKMAFTFKLVNWTSCGTVYYAVQGDSNFKVFMLNPSVWPFKWKLLSSTFMMYCLLCCVRWFYLLTLWIKVQCMTIQMNIAERYFYFILLYEAVLTFKSVDKTLISDHSNESCWAVLSCGTVYYAVQGGFNFLVGG